MARALWTALPRCFHNNRRSDFIPGLPELLEQPDRSDALSVRQASRPSPTARMRCGRRLVCPRSQAADGEDAGGAEAAYACRNVRMGSTFAARAAGIHAASRQTATIRPRLAR